MKLFLSLLFVLGAIATIAMLTIDLSPQVYNIVRIIAFASGAFMGVFIILGNLINK